EFERLAFRKTGKARLLHRRNMDEHVLAAVIADDEAEALLGIEELDHALALADDLGRHSAARPAEAASTTAAAAVATATAAAAEAVAAAIAVTAAISAAETVAAAEAAISVSAAVVVLSEPVALVSTAPTAIAPTSSIKTHALIDFQVPLIPSEPPRWAKRAN